MRKKHSNSLKKYVNSLFVALMVVCLGVLLALLIMSFLNQSVYAAESGEAATEESMTDFSEYDYDDDKAIALAQLMWGEARGCSKREQSLIAWTVLNRVDVGYNGASDFWTILTMPNQFYYSSGFPYEEYEHEIAIDVLQRWAAEKDGVEDSGRTLPKGYLYYYGDGVHNYFSTNGSGGELWFGLGDPYENW